MINHFPVLTVSQLNRQVKNYLEHELSAVHVEGELSNLSKPSSGHFYFTLKDNNAQIRCVFFKNRHQHPLVNTLENGQKVIASGKLSLFEARGDYQLIVEQLTEAGLGELYQRFEALKNKLADEGLFLQSRKKALPPFPHTIGVITSTTGAAIQDILSTLARRFPIARVIIYASEVQGATAASQLSQALKLANTDKRCEVLILARGGGSIEDLWAFNEEQLAREIALSIIPIVSGVGHETDSTIADFVADYRAETPTAAAIAVTPNLPELLNLLTSSISRARTALIRQWQHYQLKINYLSEKIGSLQGNLLTYWQRLDFLERQLHSCITQIIRQKNHQVSLHIARIKTHNPQTQLKQKAMHLKELQVQLEQQMQIKLKELQHQFINYLSTLHAVSPLATLERGYAIACKKNTILFSSLQVDAGDVIDVRLAKGTLVCEVIASKEEACSTN